MKRLLPCILTILAAARVALADVATDLSPALVGRDVVIGFSFPAHQVGVEIDAASGAQLLQDKYRRTLKMWGPAYQVGDTATITRVTARGDRIEIWLGRGGYGSFGSITDSYATEMKSTSPDEARLNAEEREIDEREAERRRYHQDLTPEERAEIDRKKQAIHAEREAVRSRQLSEVSKSSALRYGSRLHVRYSGRPPAVNELRRALLPYLTFLEPTSPVPAADDSTDNR
jgi:hypothetical protein